MNPIDEGIKKALLLGIPKQDLSAAIVLIRNFRIKVIAKGINPRAFRIALIYGLLTDSHASKDKLKPGEDAQLREIAELFYLIPGFIYKNCCVKCPDKSFKNCSSCFKTIRGVDEENE